MIRQACFFPAALRLLCLAAITLAAGGMGGCAGRSGQDFPAIFAMMQTAPEALEALQPPQVVRLQDDMTVYSWQGRNEVLTPAHYAFVRRRFPSRSGFYDYDYVWFPESVHIAWCSARMIARPDGIIVHRAWRGNDCERFVRAYPAWYDRENPGIRRAVTGG